LSATRNKILKLLNRDRSALLAFDQYFLALLFFKAMATANKVRSLSPDVIKKITKEELA